MSNINTNGINSNYPTPGVNNSTQGMRDNFTSIKTNLGTAKDEITDLQNKVIVKAALDGTALNNDMAGAVLANVTTKSFRESSWPLASGNIGSSVLVDVSKGDVQYGNIVENTTISFGGWSPTGTQSQVQLNLTIANSAASIQLPETTFGSNVSLPPTTGMRESTGRMENLMSYDVANTTYRVGYYKSASTTIIPIISFPQGTTEVQLRFTTIDCGTTLEIEPITRNQKAGQIEYRTPGATGAQGDFPGAICTNGSNLYICSGAYDGSTSIWKYVTLNTVT